MVLSPYFRQVVRGLQLPVPYGHDHEVYNAVHDALSTGNEKTPDDVALALSDGIEEWSLTGKPAKYIKTAVRAALSLFNDDYAVSDEAYFKAYGKLRGGNKRDFRAVPHETAIRLLSRTRTIGYLVAQERYSCSQVALTLAATEKSLTVSYKAVQAITDALGVTPALDENAAGKSLRETDSARAELIFADSDARESCTVAAEHIASLAPGTTRHVEDSLVTMLEAPQTRKDAQWSYLQILHWCITPLEFYDHPASFLYEFSPRSNLATEIMEFYPASTGNAILNNAKAVSAFDRSWANNRYAIDGHAVVALLELLESLPFVARRDVARILRSWLVRIVELKKDPYQPLPEMFFDEYVALSEYLAEHDTGTQGVIEQRAVDALSVLAYGGVGWVPRGLGDSVHASNLSRKKLGDIEFANLDLRRAIALEAHGGPLSPAYVRAHQKSLARIIDMRLEDSWAALDEPSNWSIEVVFIAHDLAENLPTSEVISDVPVSYIYIDYKTFIDRTLASHGRESVASAFDTYFLAAMNERRVRQSAREQVVKLVDAW
jgi:hypothetical protein